MNKNIVISFTLGFSLGIPLGLCIYKNEYYKRIRNYIKNLFISSNRRLKTITRKTSLSSIPETDNENDDNNNDNNEVIVLKDKIMKTLITSCDNISGSYKTLDSVLITLRISRVLLESEFISSINSINTFYDMLNELEKKWILMGKDGFRDIQVICIEGLGSSGKSTLVSGLSKYNAKLITVSSEINKLKAELSCSQNINSEILLKAIDVVSLYQLAIQAIESNENVILLERYYHSYAVQNICDNIMTDVEMTSLDQCALVWPIDLPKPTLVIFLSVSTETRLKRRKISGGSSHTVRSIERSVIRDTRALSIYGKIIYSDIIAVDASGIPDEVLNNSLALCKEYNIHLKYPTITSKEEKRISLGVYGAFDKFI